MRRLLDNGVHLLLNSVQDSTKKSYDVGIRKWFSFCQTISCEPFLRTEPLLWSSLGSAFSFREGVMMAFISHLFFDKSLKPTTISTYLASIKYLLKTSGVDIFFLSSPAVSSVRTGMCLVFRRNNLAADTRTLPITVDFILFARRLYGMGTPEKRVIVVALILAFTCLFRSCEYVGKYKLRSRDVIFEFKVSGRVSPVLVCAYDESLSKFSKDDLCGVIVHNAGAKNDPEGEGYRFNYPRQSPSDNAAFDIVEVLYDWAVTARVRADDPFLSYRNKWCLSYSVFQDAIKTVAFRLGLDPSRFSTHSCRIGGASLLAAAGMQDYMIQIIGRWKSLAFLTYIRSASSFFTRALSALTNPSLFTLSHLMKMNSGVAISRK